MYEIHSDYGATSFSNEDDAISALWLLGKYHNIEIDPKAVKEGLENKAYYEEFPLSIIKGEWSGSLPADLVRRFIFFIRIILFLLITFSLYTLGCHISSWQWWVIILSAAGIGFIGTNTK